MLDSTGKKLAFVSQSVEELGLSANVVHARAEEAGRGELRESFDFAVLARGRGDERAVRILPAVREGRRNILRDEGRKGQ